MNGEADPVLSGAAPGWFGKLPGMGDVAHRRLPDGFRLAWGRWLHSGLARLRDRQPAWTEHDLDGPRWCFVLGSGVIDGQCWIGVLAPSEDGTGRPCPFTIAAELVSPQTELTAEALARVRRWWRLAIGAAREGLQARLDAVDFEALLHRLFTGDVAAPGDEGGAVLALPAVGQSLWFTDPTAEGGLGMTSQGLPQDDQFEALFGCGPGGSAAEVFR